MIEELLQRINDRIADMSARSDADLVGPLKYSGSWQRRAAADHTRITELRWVQAQVADLVASRPSVAALPSIDVEIAEEQRATEAFVSDLRSLRMYIDRVLSEVDIP